MYNDVFNIIYILVDDNSLKVGQFSKYCCFYTLNKVLVENSPNIIGREKLRCQDTNTTLEGINIYKDSLQK